MKTEDYITFGEDVADDFVLRDVSEYKPYLITRHLEVGDTTFDGSEVDEPGVEFIDDVGDTVALRLSDIDCAYTITQSDDISFVDGAVIGDQIIITDKGDNYAYGDTEIGKAYTITNVLAPGEENHYGGTERLSKIEFIDDVGDTVSMIPGFAGAKHKIVKAAA